MTSDKKEKLIKHSVGSMPIMYSIAQKLGIRKILNEFIPFHGSELLPAVDAIMLLVYNLALGRRPLYELGEWVSKFDPRIFHFESINKAIFNDDRFGRALDKLHKADRATLMTRIVMKLIEVTKLDTSRIHNDSTTVKAFGKIAGTTNTGFSLERGHSKDHRPDLKQLVYSLSITADGAVPIHFKTYPGNTTDDKTHIETWDTLHKITGSNDFLYVADCKVCTDKQLSYIVENDGRVISLIPNTWSEISEFKDLLRNNKKTKKLIWKRKIPGRFYDQMESYYCFTGDHRTKRRGYTIFWIYSTEKKKRDLASRLDSLKKVEQELTDLMCRINMRNLKTKESILDKISLILGKHKSQKFFQVSLTESIESHEVQIGKGRPSVKTKYKEVLKTTYSLIWTKNTSILKAEKNIDGLFPILSTDKSLSAKEALVAYKYQPRLEKRFTNFKSIHNIAPLLFKKIERVESMMFVFLLALIVQSVIEREVRKNMKGKNIDNLPIYPEDRLAEHPTTAIIFDRFQDVSLYHLKQGEAEIKEFKDDLTKSQKKILGLLNISESLYWPN